MYTSKILTIDGHDLIPYLVANSCKVSRSVAEGENAMNTMGNDRLRDVLGFRCSIQAVFAPLTKSEIAWLEHTVLRRGMYDHNVYFDDFGIMRTAIMHGSPNFEITITTLEGKRKGAVCSFIDLYNQKV